MREPACVSSRLIQFIFVFLNFRAPFEVNTTVRCALAVLYETILTTCTMDVFCTTITLLVGFIIYTEACLLDIKTLFDQLDRLSKFKNVELLMLQRCKEALDLHGRLNGYSLRL